MSPVSVRKAPKDDTGIFRMKSLPASCDSSLGKQSALDPSGWRDELDQVISSDTDEMMRMMHSRKIEDEERLGGLIATDAPASAINRLFAKIITAYQHIVNVYINKCAADGVSPNASIVDGIIDLKAHYQAADQKRKIRNQVKSSQQVKPTDADSGEELEMAEETGDQPAEDDSNADEDSDGTED